MLFCTNVCLLCLTGVFTAPLHGLYYFRFTAYDHRPNKWMGVSLYHNNRCILGNGIPMGGTDVFISNAVALELQRGDEVYMMLPADHGLFDSSSKRTTFTGFLIFPM